MPTETIQPPAFAMAIEDYKARAWDGQAIFLAERFAQAGEELAGFERAKAGNGALPPLAGLTMTVKACFDVAGWTTSCASKALVNAPAASQTAPVVAQLLTHGATLVAQTNMTEFAYGALGVNNGFGTPRTPLDATGERVAGGSSSGAAVAVARGYCDIAVCSDTSGSARIPAAFCGVTGFKPSRGRYPTDGMKWLSTSFDVPGIITRSAALCQKVDGLLTSEAVEPAPAAETIRLALPSFYGALSIDEDIRAAVARCIAALTGAGVVIEDVPLESLQRGARIAAEGRIIGYEAYRQHKALLEKAQDLYDPLIATRLLQGAQVPDQGYEDALAQLQICRDEFDREIKGFDAFLLPTVPMMPPLASALAEPSHYLATNIRSFSLAEFANRIDLPSITLPIGGLPAGLMLTGTRGSDSRLLSIARALEPLCADAA